MDDREEILAHIYKTSRGMRYDMTLDANFRGVLIEPSLSRIAFIISNPFPVPLQLCTEAITTADVGIVLQPLTGPTFFTLNNTYGAIRQRWHWRLETGTVGAQFTVIDIQLSNPL